MLSTTTTTTTINNELLQQQEQEEKQQEYKILESLNLLSGLTGNQQIVKYVTRLNNNTTTTIDSHGNNIDIITSGVGFLQVDDLLSTTSTIKSTTTTNSTAFFDMLNNN
eukprot:UN06560